MKKLLFLLLFFLLVGCSNNLKKAHLASNDADINPDSGSINSPGNAEDDFVNDQDSFHKNEEDLKDESEENDLSTDGSSDSDFQPEPIAFGAHFAEIDRVKYTLDGVDRHSAAARMFYTFQPADKSPETAPLFVFFNGGPGSPTTLLFTFNTSKMTADPDFTGGEGVVDNPYSFTKLGNIIHVDERQTGFSYELGEGGCSVDSINTFFDAADFVRVILDVFRRFPILAKNPVYIVGESYGGKRANIMLNMILFYEEYLKGSKIFKDPELFSALDSHFRQIFPDENGKIGPEVVSKQFTGQVLIQPSVTRIQEEIAGEMLNSPGSPLYDLAEEMGTVFEPAPEGVNKARYATEFVQKNSRDWYAYHKPLGYMDQMGGVGAKRLTTYQTLKKMLGSDPLKIMLFSADQRIGGYRCEGSSQNNKSGDLENYFGQLNVFDRYYLSSTIYIIPTFGLWSKSTDWDPDDAGKYFLRNIRYIKTFVTNASKDIVVYSPAIPETLKTFTEFVDDIELGPDQFNVIYKDGEKVTVTFPVYPESGHCVPMFEPEKFLNDVAEWIEK